MRRPSRTSTTKVGMLGAYYPPANPVHLYCVLTGLGGLDFVFHRDEKVLQVFFLRIQW